MREREKDGGVSGWEKEGDWKRERRGSETDVPKLYTYNENEHSVILTYGHCDTYRDYISDPQSYSPRREWMLH